MEKTKQEKVFQFYEFNNTDKKRSKQLHLVKMEYSVRSVARTKYTILHR